MKHYLSPLLTISSPNIGVFGNSSKKMEKIIGNHFVKVRYFGNDCPMLNNGKKCQKLLIVEKVKSR